MMNCKDVQELFGLYRDLPEGDLRKTAVDEHIPRCKNCSEEFRIWEESAELIKHTNFEDVDSVPKVSISASVMDRIYQDESWRLPVTERAYSLTRQMKYRISAVIGLCLALFISSLIFSITSESSKVEAYTFRPGVVPVSAQTADNGIQFALFSEEIPIASLSAPIVLDMGTANSYPDYLVIVSILGVISSLLFMNWLSRLRA